MKRLENESFEDYKERRKTNQEEKKQELKCKLFWDFNTQGTYKG